MKKIAPILLLMLVMQFQSCSVGNDADPVEPNTAPEDVTAEKKKSESSTSARLPGGMQSELIYRSNTNDPAWESLYGGAQLFFNGPDYPIPNWSTPYFQAYYALASGSPNYSFEGDMFSFSITFHSLEQNTSSLILPSYNIQKRQIEIDTVSISSYQVGSDIVLTGKIIALDGKYYCVQKKYSGTQYPD